MASTRVLYSMIDCEKDSLKLTEPVCEEEERTAEENTFMTGLIEPTDIGKHEQATIDENEQPETEEKKPTDNNEIMFYTKKPSLMAVLVVVPLLVGSLVAVGLFFTSEVKQVFGSNTVNVQNQKSPRVSHKLTNTIKTVFARYRIPLLALFAVFSVIVVAVTIVLLWVFVWGPYQKTEPVLDLEGSNQDKEDAVGEDAKMDESTTIGVVVFVFVAVIMISGLGFTIYKCRSLSNHTDIIVPDADADADAPPTKKANQNPLDPQPEADHVEHIPHPEGSAEAAGPPQIPQTPQVEPNREPVTPVDKTIMGEYNNAVQELIKRRSDRTNLSKSYSKNRRLNCRVTVNGKLMACKAPIANQDITLFDAWQTLVENNVLEANRILIPYNPKTKSTVLDYTKAANTDYHLYDFPIKQESDIKIKRITKVIRALLDGLAIPPHTVTVE